MLLVDAVLDEDLLQRGIEILLFQFGFLDLQLLAQQVFGVVRRKFEQGRYVGEDWFFVLNDTAVRRDGHLAIGERIERIDRLVG